MLDLQEEQQDVDKHLQESRLLHTVPHNVASLAEEKKKFQIIRESTIAMVYIFTWKNQGEENPTALWLWALPAEEPKYKGEEHVQMP